MFFVWVVNWYWLIFCILYCNNANSYFYCFIGSKRQIQSDEIVQNDSADGCNIRSPLFSWNTIPASLSKFSWNISLYIFWYYNFLQFSSSEFGVATKDWSQGHEKNKIPQWWSLQYRLQCLWTRPDKKPVFRNPDLDLVLRNPDCWLAC